MFIPCYDHCTDSECDACMRRAAVDIKFSRCITTLQQMTDTVNALARAPTGIVPAVQVDEGLEGEEDSLVTEVKDVRERTIDLRRSMRRIGGVK